MSVGGTDDGGARLPAEGRDQRLLRRYLRDSVGNKLCVFTTA